MSIPGGTLLHLKPVYKLWVYGHYKYLLLFKYGDWRQILTSKVNPLCCKDQSRDTFSVLVHAARYIL